jgi:hypothetical protein
VNIERLNRITVEDGKCGSRPCIRGYRIRVTDILQLLAAGATIDEILVTTPSWNRKTSTLRSNTQPARQTIRSSKPRDLSGRLSTADSARLYCESASGFRSRKVA